MPFEHLTIPIAHMVYILVSKKYLFEKLDRKLILSIFEIEFIEKTLAFGALHNYSKIPYAP